MGLNIQKREFNVRIVLFGVKKMEYITVAGPFATIEEAEKTMKELQAEISLGKGFWTISETMYYTS